MQKTKKALVLVLALVLVCGISVMGTMAYLTSTTDTVTNTFTVGNVEITLDESKVGDDGKILTGDDAERVFSNKYHLVPGGEYDKDPTVHVIGGSDECYVFVKVANELESLTVVDGDRISSQLYNNGWSIIGSGMWIYTGIDENGNHGTIGKAVTVGDDDMDLPLFTKIKIPNTAVGADLEKFNGATIDITACAIQAGGFADGAAAKAELPKEFLKEVPIPEGV